MTRDRWRDIRAAIEQDIMDGVLERGSRLPTEPELAEIYASGRHSVRRAVAELAKDGHLSIEQGRGTFVLPRPRLEYAIGSRTRLRRNLGAQGVDIAGQMLGVERRRATAKVATSLGIDDGAEVVATQRLTLADGVPISFGTIFHDMRRFPDFPERRQIMASVSAVYASYGIEDYLRGSTTLHARRAEIEEARLLGQHAEAPVIVVHAVDTELDGTPLAYSEVIWSAARVSFAISHPAEGA